MTEQEFDRLTAKYQTDECTPEELLLLETWAGKMVEQSTAMAVFPQEEEADATEARIWRCLMPGITPSEQGTEGSGKVWLRSLLLAAACLSVACLYYLLDLNQSLGRVEVLGHGIETKNTTASTQKVFLADGSTVVLEKGANILIDESFGNKTRTVYLTGGAFFDINRNEKVPFLVYSGGLVTEVLGTSFYIKPQGTGKSIEVSVKSGRVSVYASQTQKAGRFDGVILTPNQKVLFDPELQTIRQEIVETPRILTAEREAMSFDFHGESIENTINRMRTAYGVDIVLPGSGLGRCKFTGNLSGLPMYDQLRFVCESVGARFETRGATIFIMGDGCE